MIEKTIEKIRQVFSYKDLRKKILFTLWILLIFRLGTHIPVPGVNIEALKTFFSQNRLFGFLDIFSGGAMSQFSILMLGVSPYISASIIFQLLTAIIPSLEALSKEGEEGQRKINRYSRYLTVPLAALESLGMIVLLSHSELGIIPVLSLEQKIITTIILTSGAILVMWLGELISERGIGNGISLILTFGILSRVPLAIRQVFIWADSFDKKLAVLIFLIMGIAVILGIVFVDQAMRKIPVSYAKRIRGMRMYGGTSTFLPLKINQAGVLPIIFAMSFMLFPGVVGNFLTTARSSFISKIGYFLSHFFRPENIIYGILYFILVILFTYFYSSIVFNPQNIAENLQKQGGFVPGMRPGKPTADFLSHLITRINLPGGIFLGTIAVMPFLVERIYPGISLTLGGTALLIVIAVIIQTTKQIESQLIMRSYES